MNLRQLNELLYTLYTQERRNMLYDQNADMYSETLQLMFTTPPSAYAKNLYAALHTFFCFGMAYHQIAQMSVNVDRTPGEIEDSDAVRKLLASYFNPYDDDAAGVAIEA